MNDEDTSPCARHASAAVCDDENLMSASAYISMVSDSNVVVRPFILSTFAWIVLSRQLVSSSICSLCDASLLNFS